MRQQTDICSKNRSSPMCKNMLIADDDSAKNGKMSFPSLGNRRNLGMMIKVRSSAKQKHKVEKQAKKLVTKKKLIWALKIDKRIQKWEIWLAVRMRKRAKLQFMTFCTTCISGLKHAKKRHILLYCTWKMIHMWKYGEIWNFWQSCNFLLFPGFRQVQPTVCCLFVIKGQIWW